MQILRTPGATYISISFCTSLILKGHIFPFSGRHIGFKFQANHHLFWEVLPHDHFLLLPRYKQSFMPPSPPSELHWPQLWLHSSSIFYCTSEHRDFVVVEFVPTLYSIEDLAHSSCLINGCSMNLAKD